MTQSIEAPLVVAQVAPSVAQAARAAQAAQVAPSVAQAARAAQVAQAAEPLLPAKIIPFIFLKFVSD
jgi:hypothetical protein